MTDNELTTEMCPHCDTEVEIPPYLGIYECPNCGKLIVACSMCETQNCGNCQYLIREQLYKYKQALEEIKSIVSGKYEALDPLAKQQIFQKCEVLNKK